MHTKTIATFKMDQKFKAATAAGVIGFLIAVFVSPAHGAAESTPLLRSSTVSVAEAEGFSEAMQRQIISKAMDQSPDEPVDQLASLLQEAQENWLSGSIDAAREKFGKMSGLALKADWREPERDTIVYAMIRLAQLAKNELERDSMLKRAVLFSADARVDEDLFPPPLIQRMQEIRNLAQSPSINSKSHLRVRLKDIFRSADFVRINGKKYALESDHELVLRPGEYRVSIYSNFALPYSAVMTDEEIRQFSYNPKPLANGTCGEPLMGVSSTMVKIDVLYPNGCVRTWDRTHWLPQSTPERAEAAGSSAVDLPNADSTQVGPAPVNGKIPSDWLPHPEEGARWPGAPQEKAIWEKKETWIWVGITAVVAGAAYAVYQNQHPARTHIQPNSSEIN